jgi:hypothetical protein
MLLPWHKFHPNEAVDAKVHTSPTAERAASSNEGLLLGPTEVLTVARAEDSDVLSDVGEGPAAAEEEGEMSIENPHVEERDEKTMHEEERDEKTMHAEERDEQTMHRVQEVVE